MKDEICWTYQELEKNKVFDKKLLNVIKNIAKTNKSYKVIIDYNPFTVNIYTKNEIMIIKNENEIVVEDNFKKKLSIKEK